MISAGPEARVRTSHLSQTVQQMFREPPSTKEYQETGYYELV